MLSLLLFYRFLFFLNLVNSGVQAASRPQCVRHSHFNYCNRFPSVLKHQPDAIVQCDDTENPRTICPHDSCALRVECKLFEVPCSI